MKLEQLKRGNEIQQLITSLKFQRNNWNETKSFNSIQGIREQGNYTNLVPDRMPVDIIKAIVIADYDKEIAALESELSNL